MVNSNSLTLRSLHMTDVALKKEPGATFISQNAKIHCVLKAGQDIEANSGSTRIQSCVLQRDSAFWEMHLGYPNQGWLGLSRVRGRIRF